MDNVSSINWPTKKFDTEAVRSQEECLENHKENLLHHCPGKWSGRFADLPAVFRSTAIGFGTNCEVICPKRITTIK